MQKDMLKGLENIKTIGALRLNVHAGPDHTPTLSPPVTSVLFKTIYDASFLQLLDIHSHTIEDLRLKVTGTALDLILPGRYDTTNAPLQFPKVHTFTVQCDSLLREALETKTFFQAFPGLIRLFLITDKYGSSSPQSSSRLLFDSHEGYALNCGWSLMSTRFGGMARRMITPNATTLMTTISTMITLTTPATIIEPTNSTKAASTRIATGDGHLTGEHCAVHTVAHV